jgi:cell division protein FtsA
MMHKESLLAAIDLGNSQTCCLIAFTAPGAEPVIIGSATMESKGMKYGMITDLDACAAVVMEVLSKAEKEAGVRVKQATVGLCPVQTRVSWNEGRLPTAQKPLCDHHLHHLDQATFTSGLQANDYRMHCLKTSYLLDGKPHQGSVQGLLADDLAMASLCVDMRRAIIDNVKIMLKKCHLHHYTFVFSPLASALSCLSEEEKDVGTFFLDMGSETTSYVCFREGQVVDAGVVPLGGEHITRDIAVGLGVSRNEAERIKTLYGSGFQHAIDRREYIDITPLPQYQTLNKLRVPKPDLTHMIQARVEEIFERVSLHSTSLSKVQYVALAGGSSELPGVADVGGEMLKKHKIRLCVPKKLPQLPSNFHAPSFSSVLGLLSFPTSLGSGDLAPTWHTYQGMPTWRRRTMTWFRDYF